MTVVQGPLFDLSQLSSHLTSNLCLALRFNALSCCAISVGSLRGCKACKASLGFRSAATAAMEPTPAIALGPRTLAQGPATGLGFAPNSLPVWAVEPWFGIGFHCAQLSSIHGVLLYLILEVIARHACLGPRTAVQAKLNNANWAQTTLIIGRRCAIYCPLEPLAPYLKVRCWAKTVIQSSCSERRLGAQSVNSDFLAARARSTENAATA